jgi:FkbM family methyltransferase
MGRTIEFPSDGYNDLRICRFGPMLFNRHDAYVGRSLDIYGEYGAAEAALFQQIVSPGMWVIEIGANIGSHTIQLSRLAGDAGKVIAFEPQRLTFQTLCANAALSSRKNIHTFQMGLSDGAGEGIEAAVDPDAASNFGAITLEDAGTDTRILDRVPIQTLDSFGYPKCHFLKIDVESMEAKVLRGAKGTIARCRPVIFVENDRKPKSSELIDLLFSYGYDCYWVYTDLHAPGNFNNSPENIFPGLLSISLLCLPAETQMVVQGFAKVTGPDDVGQNIWVS